MTDKIFISLMVSLVISGVSLIIYSAINDNEFIAKCQSNGGIPTVGKGVHLCSKPDSIIEIN